MDDETVPQGATLGGDTSGLIRIDLTTQAARNAAETESIDEANAKYVFKPRPKQPGSGWLTDKFIRKVHSDMFGSIWEWGGQYRRHNTLPGIEWPRISEEILKLCGDFAYWDKIRPMAPLEIAAYLHHRLVWIHPFANGNGRHARLITDIFFCSCEHPLPKWPQIHRMPHGDGIRIRYINALKEADEGKYESLMSFMNDYM